MLVLALETSTETGSVALLKDRIVISRREWRREKSHSELLTSKIEECFIEGNVEAKSVSRVAVGYGPGSFTGIRIAINAAKVFAYSAECKIFATDTFRIIAEPTRLQPLPILGLLNAHKNLIYAAAIQLDAQSLLAPIYSLKPEALSIIDLEAKIQTSHLCLGDGFDLWKESFSSNFLKLLVRDPNFSDEPSAAHLGRIASLAREEELITWQTLQPLYIRASEPEEKLKAGLLTDRSRINEG